MPEKSEIYKILMFAPSCFPVDDSEAIVNAKLVLAMKNKGWNVEIITFPERGSFYPSGNEFWNDIKNSSQFYYNKYRMNLPNKIWTALRSLLLTGKLIGGDKYCALSAFDVVNKLSRKIQYDFIISRSNPDHAHLAALMYHRRTKIPWIANWNDPQPSAKFPPPSGKGPSYPMNYFYHIFYQAVAAHCSWHTFPCERLRKYMTSYLPSKVSQKSSVVPHIALKRFCVPRIQHDGFSIYHTGYIGPPRDVSVFLEGAKRFYQKFGKPKNFHIKFVVDQPDIVVYAAKVIKVENIVRIEESRPYEKMPELLASADVLAIIEAPLREGIFLPSKFVDYVQTGHPILSLSPTIGTINDILSTYGGGIAVDGCSPDAVARAIGVLYSHWKAGTLDSEYGSSKLLDLYSEERVLDLYSEIFKKD
ncbi:hypothetical protein ACFL5H_02720 [Candidatus Latescibacterota bacterium]